MSKIKLSKKLKINKQILSKLQESQMTFIKGGKNFKVSTGPWCSSCRAMSCKSDELERIA